MLPRSVLMAPLLGPAHALGCDAFANFAAVSAAAAGAAAAAAAGAAADACAGWGASTGATAARSAATARAAGAALEGWLRCACVSTGDLLSLERRQAFAWAALSLRALSAAAAEFDASPVAGFGCASVCACTALLIALLYVTSIGLCASLTGNPLVDTFWGVLEGSTDTCTADVATGVVVTFPVPGLLEAAVVATGVFWRPQPGL